MNENFVEIKLLRKQYQQSVAVADISFNIARGEFVALLGPSGCGKSTTLKMLAGLETPTSGQIFIDGDDVTNAPPSKRHISMVFQSYALFPHLNVRENILFGLKARHVPKAEQQRRLAHAAQLVALSDLLERKPGQLSGGQCQRVALARSIVSEAPLCLMDEPLSNLDAKLRNEMRSEICALQQKLELTVLYVTHDQTEAMSMADKIILLNHGKIEQMGAPDELYTKPNSQFVAEFIGHPNINFISCGEINIGVRPLDIVQNPSDAQRALEVEILRCEYHGAHTLIFAQHQAGMLNFSLMGKHEFAANSRCRIGWDIAAEHYFDAHSGQRINAEVSIDFHNLGN